MRQGKETGRAGETYREIMFIINIFISYRSEGLAYINVVVNKEALLFHNKAVSSLQPPVAKQVFEHRFILYTWENDENLQELLINIMFQLSFKHKPRILFRKHLHFTCNRII